MERYLDHNDDKLAKLHNYWRLGRRMERQSKQNWFSVPYTLCKGRSTSASAIWRCPRQGIFRTLNSRQFFSEITIVAGHILVIFASLQLQILLISIRSTDEQFCRMGSLAWLGYLSYTQVVESSNLSPSIIYYAESFLAIYLAEKSQKIVHPIQDVNKEMLA